MADTIIDGTQFNAEIIRYSAPKAGGSGGKSINILNSGTKTGVRISTPLMLTWGASDFVDASTGKGNGKFEMALQFPSADYKTEDAEIFLKNMQDLENKIKADALTNSKDWFGKVHKNAEVVDALWTPMLKYSKDKATGEQDLTKAPSIRIKMPFWDGVWKVEIYDEDGQKLFPNSATPGTTPIDLIQKGTNVAVIMQCGGLWFANGKFGITWKLVQAVVQKPKTSLAGTCFIKLKASDKEKLKTAAPVVEEERFEEICPTTNVEVEDSDEEEEEEDAPADPTPVPVVEVPVVEVAVEEPKKVVKKVVKKKV